MSKASAPQGHTLPHMTVDQKEGIIKAFGERFRFIPINLIHSMEDRLTETLGAAIATSFEYEIGKQGGANFIRLAKHAGLGIKSSAEIQRVADSLGTLSGWGKLDIVSFDFGKKNARIKWINGVSVRNHSGKTAVCHFGRGILTGAVAEIRRGQKVAKSRNQSAPPKYMIVGRKSDKCIRLRAQNNRLCWVG